MLSTQTDTATASPTRPWPADQVERWPIERLKPYANNPRLHSEADLGKIAAAIRQWGWSLGWSSTPIEARHRRLPAPPIEAGTPTCCAMSCRRSTSPILILA